MTIISSSTIYNREAPELERLRACVIGQVLIPADEVARLLTERRARPRVAAGSVRNRFPGVVTEVKRDKVAATVEILAGPHRILAFITREAVDEMGLKPGMHAVATVKATNVMVELAE